MTLLHVTDLSPATLHRTLEVALGMGFGQPRLQGPDARGRLQLRQPLPPRWVSLIDEHLRLPGRSGEQGALPNLIFDAQLFLSKAGERPVFRPTRDTVLLHLGHPLFRQALSAFARARFPGRHDGGSASRWTCRRADPSEIPVGAAALLLLTIEELAVNELREPMHHWVRTLRIPLQEDRGGARLLAPLLYQPPGRPDNAAPADPPPSAAQVQRARALWDDVSQDIRALLTKLCVADYADCDANKLTNGCEVNTKTSALHCGGCGKACSSNNIPTPACTAGLCSGTCAANFGDCDNNKSTNGCETPLLTSISNCGACGKACSSNNVPVPACTAGLCNGSCAAGFGDCNNNKQTDGCETPLLTSSFNCGACGKVCSANHVTPVCTSGSCQGSTCAAGYSDCNSDKQSDRCETLVDGLPALEPALQRRARERTIAGGRMIRSGHQLAGGVLWLCSGQDRRYPDTRAVAFCHRCLA